MTTFILEIVRYSVLRSEIFLIELLPGCEHLSPAHQPNVIEHVLVVEGSIEILLNHTWKSLTKGEGLRFDAHQSHSYRNLSKQNSIIYNIIHYPQI